MTSHESILECCLLINDQLLLLLLTVGQVALIRQSMKTFGERGGFTCVSSRSLLKVHLRYWEILKDGGEGTISRPQEERGSTI